MNDAARPASADDPFQGFRLQLSDRSTAIARYGAQLVSHSACEDSGVHAVLAGRLYYRDEVREEEAASVARAYAEGGVDALTRLEGEFAAVVLDTRRRTVVALRDPMGGYPIYWRHAGGALTLASSVRLLATSLTDAELDEDFFGEFLTQPYAENDYFEETPIRGIRRLPSGFVLVAESGQEPRIRRYWNWLDRIDDPGDRPVAEIGERYGELLRAATRQRLRGRVAAHLSGGMDSTATALLAAREGGSVEALCLVYERFRDLALETPYLESALGHPGIAANRIPADDILDYDTFRDLPVYDEPFSGLYRTGTDIAMTNVAAGHGCGTILTGVGADEMLDAAPFHMADLLRRGRALAAWREAANWAHRLNTDPWRIARFFALRPLVPPWLQPGLGPLFRGGFASWGSQSASTIPPWVNRDFAARARIQARIHERLAASTRSAGTVVASDVLGRLRQSCGDWVRYNIGAPRGVHIAHPFRDPRVMSFGFGARLRVRPDPRQQKIVLAHAMRDVLPQKILRRADKGHFNGIYYAGLARNADYLEAMLRQADVERFFDKAELIDSLKRSALAYQRIDGKVGLDNSLIIAKWLSMLPRWRRFQPVPAAVMRHDFKT